MARAVGGTPAHRHQKMKVLCNMGENHHEQERRAKQLNEIGLTSMPQESHYRRRTDEHDDASDQHETRGHSQMLPLFVRSETGNRQSRRSGQVLNDASVPEHIANEECIRDDQNRPCSASDLLVWNRQSDNQRK